MSSTKPKIIAKNARTSVIPKSIFVLNNVLSLNRCINLDLTNHQRLRVPLAENYQISIRQEYVIIVNPIKLITFLALSRYGYKAKEE